jgi:hypothetical protein
MTTRETPNVIIIKTIDEVTNATTLELYLRGKQAEGATSATIHVNILMRIGMIGKGNLSQQLSEMVQRNGWGWTETGQSVEVHFATMPVKPLSEQLEKTAEVFRRAEGAPKKFDPLADDESIKEMMSYHAPDEDQKLAFTNIAAAAIIFANVLRANVPACADRTHALRCLRDARMWANSAVALKGKI